MSPFVITVFCDGSLIVTGTIDILKGSQVDSVILAMQDAGDVSWIVIGELVGVEVIPSISVVMVVSIG